jgi:hypothetical protein
MFSFKVGAEHCGSGVSSPQGLQRAIRLLVWNSEFNAVDRALPIKAFLSLGDIGELRMRAIRLLGSSS